MKQTNKNPYAECETCKDLSDCAHPDVEDLGDCVNPMPPDVCLKPMEVMKATWKKYRKRESKPKKV